MRILRYKKYWSVRAMAERARHHPNQTAAMREALAMFDKWLLAEEPRPAPTDEEMAQRRYACISKHVCWHMCSACMLTFALRCLLACVLARVLACVLACMLACV